MLRLVFTANDFASTQFLAQPAPALELKFAARALRQGISTPWGERWRYRALAASPTSSVSVRMLTSHFTWSIFADDDCSRPRRESGDGPAAERTPVAR
jgi:hypothetical protein